VVELGRARVVQSGKSINMGKATGVTYAVAVRDGDDLFTVLTVNRKPSGDVYANVLRPHDPNMKPHGSYHASGQHHAKTYNHKVFVRHLQPPDKNFRGKAQVETVVITSNDHRLINEPCQPSDFTEVFEIPYDDVKDIVTGRLCVDISEPGAGHVSRFPGEKVLRQAVFKDIVPWIVVTLIDIGRTVERLVCLRDPA
jgi:hypothetical protein